MKILGYVTSADTVTEQDAKTLTHINVAFGKLHRDGTIDVSKLDILEKMDQIRNWNPSIKIIVSIVPEAGELEAFTVCADSEELRRKVADSCVKMVTKYHFDGVDFDWEYPCVSTHGVGNTIADKHNYTLLCQAVREAFEELPGHPLVTIAAGADLFYVESVELPELVKYLDYICLMTYDLKGDFHALTGHHTALFSTTGDIFRNSCDQALRLFHEAGVPKEKLLMGAAFYSRKWEGIRDFHHGFLQLSRSGAGYGPDYHDLVADCIDKNGFVRYWDEEAKAPWLFDGSTFLSYDDEESIGYKCDYIRAEGYGGIFYWEHGADRTGALLAAIGKKMK